MKNIFKRGFGAFTMAEILLSLTIIGVVAAITLPSLTGNINERTWATQKKALYARMAQAFPLLDSVNTFSSAEAFVAGGLNGVTKVNNICAAGNIGDCGVNTTAITTLNGNVLTEFPVGWTGLGFRAQAAGSGSGTTTTGSTTTTGGTGSGGTGVDPEDAAVTAAFETGNGESVVLYYNPNCMPDQESLPTSGSAYEEWFDSVCVNMLYDLNGNKGPNTVGKDIGFITVFHPTDSIVVAPIPDVYASYGSTTCSSDDFRLPNKYEAASMSLNNMFMNASDAGQYSYITSSKTSSSSGTVKVYIQGKYFYAQPTSNSSSGFYGRCIKR